MRHDIVRALRLVALAAVLAGIGVGCVPSLGARKPTVVNVVVVTWPGGGAPPQVLSLYKAALEVTKAAPGDYELKLSIVSPVLPDPMSSSSQQISPVATALEQALGQSPPPDIVLFSSWYEFAAAVEKDLLAPLDDVARSERAFKLDDYYPGALEAVSDQGRLYGLPLAATPLVFQYDRRLFDAAGLEAPDGTWSWSGLLSAARQLTNPNAEGGPQFGLNVLGGNWLPALIWQNGGELVSKDGRRSLVAEPAALEAVKFYSDLIHTHKVASPPPSKGRDGMPTARAPAIALPGRAGEYPPIYGPGGRVAMQPISGTGYFMGGPFGVARSGERPLRLAEPPRGKQQATLLDLQAALALTTASPNPKVAFKALVALAAEMQREMTVPATRSAAKRLTQINPNLQEDDAKVLLAAMEYGRAMPLYRYNRYGSVLFQKLLGPLQNGDKDPADVAREAAQAIDEVLNKSLEELQSEGQGQGQIIQGIGR